VEVSLGLSEENKVIDYFSNFIFSCTGTYVKAFNLFQEVPKKGSHSSS